MQIRQPLPAPPPQALQHSEQLRQLIIQAIAQNGGSIPFAQFMQMALYQPGFGYYVAGQEKFGAEGDFVTAPEISALFSHCIANHCASVLTRCLPQQSPNHSTILELGAGSGIMAADILQRLATLDALPERYLILEPGTELRQRQHETLRQRCPQLLARVQWLQQLPTQPIRGIILANEVMDAMPITLFNLNGGNTDRTDHTHIPKASPAATRANDATTQAYTNDTAVTINSVQVVHHNGTLQFSHGPTSPEQQRQISQRCLQTWDAHYNAYRPHQPYQSEYNPALDGWIQHLSETLLAGTILLIDYGYERSDYYRPERDQGTLLCHYRHHVHDQPLLWPGLQDITCSVDFTAVAAAADQAELAIAAYQTQADFLFNNGLEALFNQALDTHPEQQYRLAQQVRTLTLPSEMGERFKVMALTKGFTSTQQANTLVNLEQADRRHRRSLT